jgi:flagellar hook-basal body complex protein FliE
MMDIASIMSKVIPGTFAPDMSASEAPSIGPIPGLGAGASAPAASTDGTDAVPAVGALSFKDTLRQKLTDVNDAINTSDQGMRDLATGQSDDINGVVMSVEKANLALNYTMAIRTKLLDAYSEIERMAV